LRRHPSRFPHVCCAVALLVWRWRWRPRRSWSGTCWAERRGRGYLRRQRRSWMAVRPSTRTLLCALRCSADCPGRRLQSASVLSTSASTTTSYSSAVAQTSWFLYLHPPTRATNAPPFFCLHTPHTALFTTKIYPYHLTGDIARTTRVTPFKYYLEMMQEVMLSGQSTHAPALSLKQTHTHSHTNDYRWGGVILTVRWV